MNKHLPLLISKMSTYAANTLDDAESVMVARVANRLMHSEMLKVYPLTPDELKIIRKFISPNLNV